MISGSLQFSRYPLETAGSFDQDTHARACAAKLNTNSYSPAFMAFTLDENRDALAILYQQDVRRKKLSRAAATSFRKGANPRES